MGVIDYKIGENLANFEMFPSFFCHVYWYATGWVRQNATRQNLQCKRKNSYTSIHAEKQSFGEKKINANTVNPLLRAPRGFSNEPPTPFSEIESCSN